MTTSVDVQALERTLGKILRTLPPEKAAELVDFAEFLEARTRLEELKFPEEDVVNEADEARWDALLASEKGQSLLEELAREALEEHEAGRTTDIEVSDDGYLTPR